MELSKPLKHGVIPAHATTGAATSSVSAFWQNEMNELEGWTDDEEEEGERWQRANNGERLAGAITGNLVISPHTHTHLYTERSLSCYLTLHHAALHLHTSTHLCSLSISLPCSVSMTSNGLGLTKEERECCQLPQWGHSHTGSRFHCTTMNMALTLSPSQQLLFSTNLHKVTALFFLQLPTRHIQRHAFHQPSSCETPKNVMPSKWT